jgi:antitoxin YefM
MDLRIWMLCSKICGSKTPKMRQRHAQRDLGKVQNARQLPSLELVQISCYQLLMGNSAIDVVTYSHARQNFKEVMDRATDDHMPVVISRRDGKPAVLVSLEDWNGMQETAYLLGNEANRSALLDSLSQADRGEIIEVDVLADANFKLAEKA